LIDELLRTAGTWRADERLVVFTEYLATLDYLRARLRERYGEGDWLLTLYGGMNDAERDASSAPSTTPPAPRASCSPPTPPARASTSSAPPRYLLHWDIPWNPGKMEQRNGRLDRHGQERDVHVFHFDSSDDASMRFLGKVLRSAARPARTASSPTRSSPTPSSPTSTSRRTPTELSERARPRSSARAKLANAVTDDLPDGHRPLPGAEDHPSPRRAQGRARPLPDDAARDAGDRLAIDAGRPRLQPDGEGRDRLVPPVPCSGRSSSTTPCARRARRPDAGPGLRPRALRPAPARSGRPVLHPRADAACCTSATRSTTG
jgi:hypothetical protein